MAAKHETVLKLAQMILSKRGWRIFSNPMGKGFVGKVVEIQAVISKTFGNRVKLLPQFAQLRFDGFLHPVR